MRDMSKAEIAVSSAHSGWCSAFIHLGHGEGSQVLGAIRGHEAWMESEERRHWVARYGEELVKRAENGPEWTDPDLVARWPAPAESSS